MRYAHEYCKYKLSVVPKNMERYMAVRWGPFNFLDSMNFLPASLSDIVSSAKGYEFPLLDAFSCGEVEGWRDKEELTRKGVFPYSAACSITSLRETGFPEKEAFYSELSEQHLPAEDYEFARHMYEKSGCESLEDYMLFYVYTGKMRGREKRERERTYIFSPQMSYFSPVLCSATGALRTTTLDAT